MCMCVRGLYKAVPGFVGLYQAVPGGIRLYQAVPDCVYRVLTSVITSPSSSKTYRKTQAEDLIPHVLHGVKLKRHPKAAFKKLVKRIEGLKVVESDAFDGK